MFRPAISVLMATVSAALTCPLANAQSPAFAVAPRALCITDPYGTPYCHWYGSPMAFNSYFNYSPNGTNSFGYSFTSTGYYWSGVPSVASAATPEWTVQRTSVLLISPYSSWRPHAPYSSPWMQRFGQSTGSQTADDPSRQKLISPSNIDSSIQQISATSTLADRTDVSNFENGDRLLIKGHYVEAYLQYLKAELRADDIQELSFREAFALVLMRRHTHAVAKLKRGLASKSDPIDTTSGLERAFGDAYRIKLSDAIGSAEQWLDSNRDAPDRHFLVAVFKSLNADPSVDAHIDIAMKDVALSRHRLVLQRLLQSRQVRRPDFELNPIEQQPMPPVTNTR